MHSLKGSNSGLLARPLALQKSHFHDLDSLKKVVKNFKSLPRFSISLLFYCMLVLLLNVDNKMRIYIRNAQQKMS